MENPFKLNIYHWYIVKNMQSSVILSPFQLWFKQIQPVMNEWHMQSIWELSPPNLTQLDSVCRALHRPAFDNGKKDNIHNTDNNL